jgi:hypothetical protein
MESSQHKNSSEQRNRVRRTFNRFESFITRMFDRIHVNVPAIAAVTYSYESKHRIFNLPLLSINLGTDNPQGEMRHARGIIAIGTKATGVIAIGIFIARGVFAMAYIAIGLITINIAGVGLLTVSVFGLGVVSVAIVAIGYLAVGILAIGYKSLGIIAVGFEAIGIIGISKTLKALFPLQ